jgi:hypothetical protein
VGAEISLPKEKVFIKCAGERLEFNFSKFTNKHLESLLISMDMNAETNHGCGAICCRQCWKHALETITKYYSIFLVS